MLSGWGGSSRSSKTEQKEKETASISNSVGAAMAGVFNFSSAGTHGSGVAAGGSAKEVSASVGGSGGGGGGCCSSLLERLTIRVLTRSDPFSIAAAGAAATVGAGKDSSTGLARAGSGRSGTRGVFV